MTKDIKKEENGSQYLFLIAKISSIVISNILAGFGLGYFLEKHFPISGAWLIIGTLLGVGSGFYQTYKQIIRMQDNDKFKD